MSAKILAYGATAISVVVILGVVADFYRRFQYDLSVPAGIAGIGLFALASGIAITRVGRSATSRSHG